MTSTSKAQIDQLGDRLRKGKIDEDELRQLDAYRRSFAEAYEEVVAAIRNATGLEPTGRPAKSTTSIIEKLRRETIRLSQMQDIAGCRLVVADMPAQNHVVERLEKALPKAVVVDRREQPSHGYRAVHIIATSRGKPIEVQVRTELQHLWAQSSEKLSDVLDPTIKYGGGEQQVADCLSGLSDTVGRIERLELTLPVVGALPAVLKSEGERLRLRQQRIELAAVKTELRNALAGFIASIPRQKEQETE